MKNFKLDKKSTKDNIVINIRLDIKSLLELDYDIKMNNMNSKLIIEPINNSNYDFPFMIPEDIRSTDHTKVQFVTVMNQIKDTYGRLMRLNIKPNSLNYLLPLNYRNNATLYTNLEDLNNLKDNEQIKQILELDEIKNLLDE